MESIESLGGIASGIFWAVGLMFVLGLLFVLAVVTLVVAVRWSKKKGVDLTDGISAEELAILKRIVLEADQAEKEAALKAKLSDVIVGPKK